jgi:hypothetical protein
MTTSDATQAIARHLRGLNLQGDPDVAALEILQILRGHGWRPPQAQPAAAWKPPARPMEPGAVAAAAARARAGMRGDPA